MELKIADDAYVKRLSEWTSRIKMCMFPVPLISEDITGAELAENLVDQVAA